VRKVTIPTPPIVQYFSGRENISRQAYPEKKKLRLVGEVADEMWG